MCSFDSDPETFLESDTLDTAMRELAARVGFDWDDPQQRALLASLDGNSDDDWETDEFLKDWD